MTRPLLQSITPALLIGCWGAAGVLARYGMDRLVSRLAGGRPLLPTATVNLLGCFIMGLVLAGLPGLTAPDSPWRQALTVGFLGGFTTFSAFAGEALLLQQQGHFRASLAYLFVMPAGCLLMAGAGFALALRIWGGNTP